MVVQTSRDGEGVAQPGRVSGQVGLQHLGSPHFVPDAVAATVGTGERRLLKATRGEDVGDVLLPHETLVGLHQLRSDVHDNFVGDHEGR